MQHGADTVGIPAAPAWAGGSLRRTRLHGRVGMSLRVLQAKSVTPYNAGSERCAALYPRFGPEREHVRAGSPALRNVDTRSTQTSFVSGDCKIFHNGLQLKSLLLFVIAR